MSAYGVYQIFLANTTVLRMAPQGRRVRQMMENNNKEDEMLAVDEGGNREENKCVDQHAKRQIKTKYLFEICFFCKTCHSKFFQLLFLFML